MKHKNITYVKLHPYKYSIPFHKMINEYVRSKHNRLIYGPDIDSFKNIMFKFLNNGPEKYYIKKTPSHINIKEYKKCVREIKSFLNIKNTNNKYTRCKTKL